MLGKDLIEHPRMWQLILEVSASRLSVVAFSSYEDHALIFESIPLDSAAPTSLRALEDAVYDNPMLLLDFKRVTVIYDTTRFLPIPHAGTGLAEDLLRRIFPEDNDYAGEIITNPLPSLDIAIPFEIPCDIAGFIRRTFHNVMIIHQLMPLATYFQAKHPTRRKGKTLVNLNGDRLDIIILGDTAPLLINSCRFRDPMDAVYHILASRENLALPDTEEIMIAGDRATRVAITPVLRRYVRYVMPAIFPSAMFRAGKASLAAPFEMILAPLVS